LSLWLREAQRAQSRKEEGAGVKSFVRAYFPLKNSAFERQNWIFTVGIKDNKFPELT